MSYAQFSKHALIMSLYSINQFTFIMGTDCVLCVARIGFINKIALILATTIFN